MAAVTFGRNEKPHGDSCHCEFCLKLAGRTMDTDAWMTQHRNHGDLTQEPFPHPSGKWFWLVCECGAKHLNAAVD